MFSCHRWPARRDLVCVTVKEGDFLVIKNALIFSKKNRFLSPIYEYVKNAYISFGNRGHSRLDVLKTFPLFCPYSGGSYRIREPLALQAINDFVPALRTLGDRVGKKAVSVLTDRDYAERNGAGRTEELAELFNQYGSDKATRHGYYIVYASILDQLGMNNEINLLEIGLGTNNTDVASHMGIAGRPGASARAFRDFLPRARIFGADVDRRILFSEERIETFYVDQTDRESFLELDRALPAEMDLMIDDGLHLPTANINSLWYFLSRIRLGGFAVIEDIPRYPDAALDLWHFIGGFLPDRYDACIVESGQSLMFVLKRVG